MLSPQRAVAAASGGAGEEPNFPRARSMTTPAALPAVVRRRTPARVAVPPRPGAGTARPSLGSLSPRILGRELLAGPGRARAAPSSAPNWERPPSRVGPSARGLPPVILWAVAAGLAAPCPLRRPRGPVVPGAVSRGFVCAGPALG